MLSQERKKHKIDAAGKVLGRLATEVSRLLMGKNKVSYAPNRDMGDEVLIENVAEIKIHPKKLDQKHYYHYSGYPGGMKSKKMGNVFIKSPAEVLRRAVYNMLPKNKLRKLMMRRLIIAVEKERQAHRQQKQ